MSSIIYLSVTLPDWQIAEQSFVFHFDLHCSSKNGCELLCFVLFIHYFLFGIFYSTGINLNVNKIPAELSF